MHCVVQPVAPLRRDESASDARFNKAKSQTSVQPISSQVSSVILVWKKNPDSFQACRPRSGVPDGYLMHLSCPEVIYVGVCRERRCPPSLSQGPGRWEGTSPCMSSVDLKPLVESRLYVLNLGGGGWRLILCFQVYLEKKESEAIQALGVRGLEGHLDLQVRHEELSQLKEPVQRKRSNGLM